MIFSRLVATAQNRLEKRRRYNRLAAESGALSPRDLADMRADRGQMLRDAYKHIYG